MGACRRIQSVGKHCRKGSPRYVPLSDGHLHDLHDLRGHHGHHPRPLGHLHRGSACASCKSVYGAQGYPFSSKHKSTRRRRIHVCTPWYEHCCDAGGGPFGFQNLTWDLGNRHNYTSAGSALGHDGYRIVSKKNRRDRAKYSTDCYGLRGYAARCVMRQPYLFLPRSQLRGVDGIVGRMD